MTQTNKNSGFFQTPAESILSQILVKTEKISQKGQKTLAVFDLDSTLFDVSPRIQKILQEFTQEPLFQEHYKEWMPHLAKAQIQRTDWGFHQALERVGIESHNHELFNQLNDFWRARFFTNEYLHFDHPFEGAVDFVQQISNLGAEVVYLTGRDQHRMGPGSLEVLQKFNFPLAPPRSHLVLKPEKSMDDALFKKDWFLSQPLHTYSAIYFFENEPLNIETVRKQIPEVDIIFFDSTHSGRIEVPADLPSIKHFIIDSYQRN